MRTNQYLVISALLSLFVTGCGTGKIGPGSQESPTPPRMTVDSSNRPSWDNPNAFGPVPEAFRQTGQAVCTNIGFNKVIGYHSKALGRDGKPLPGGGYLCSN